jgi:hypothetical protein
VIMSIVWEKVRLNIYPRFGPQNCITFYNTTKWVGNNAQASSIKKVMQICNSRPMEMI